MKKFLFKLGVFCFMFFLGYVCILPLWFKLMPYQLGKNIIYKESDVLALSLPELKTNNNYDILFLGSSHTYRGLDPRIFEKNNIKIFSMGSSAQSHEQTNILVERYLCLASPSIVAYEVYPRMFGTDGNKSAISLLASLDYRADLNTFLTENLSTKKINSFIYNQYSQKFSFLNNSKILDVSKRSYVGFGCKEKKVSNSYKSSVIEKFSWEIYDKQIKAFYKSINYINQLNIPIFLYVAPITEKLYSSAQNNNEFDSLMIATGLPYINFNKTSTLTDSIHFYDKGHLNFDGVSIFNDELIDSLIVNFPMILED